MSYEVMSAVVTNDGTLYTCGNAVSGQLLNSETTVDHQSKFVNISSINDIKQVNFGDNFTFVVLNDGTCICAGANGYGQLGLGTEGDVYSTPIIHPNLNNVNHIAIGTIDCIAVLNDGTCKAFGRNGDGQLGTGDSLPHLTPCDVVGLTDVKEVAIGNYFSIALLNDGTCKVAGCSGNIGLGKDVGSNTFIDLPNISGVRHIACLQEQTILVMEDGTCQTFGYNVLDNSWNNIYTPISISGLTNVDVVFAGAEYIIALLKDKTCVAMGKNYFGELGTETTDDAFAGPVVVPNMVNVKQVACGQNHTFFLLEDRSCYSCGWNKKGQLGLDKADISIVNPTLITNPVNIDYLWSDIPLEGVDIVSDINTQIISRGNLVVDKTSYLHSTMLFDDVVEIEPLNIILNSENLIGDYDNIIVENNKFTLRHMRYDKVVDFEEQSIEPFVKNTASFVIDDTVSAYSGLYGLKGTPASVLTQTVTSEIKTNNEFKISAMVKTNTDHTSTGLTGVCFGVPNVDSDISSGKGYQVCIDVRNSTTDVSQYALQIRKDGAVIASSKDLTVLVDTWYMLDVFWNDSVIRAVVKKVSGEILGSITCTDNTYIEGLFGVCCFSSSSFDNILLGIPSGTIELPAIDLSVCGWIDSNQLNWDFSAGVNAKTKVYTKLLNDKNNTCSDWVEATNFNSISEIPIDMFSTDYKLFIKCVMQSFDGFEKPYLSSLTFTASPKTEEFLKQQ